MEKPATGHGLIGEPVWDDKRGLIYSDVITVVLRDDPDNPEGGWIGFNDTTTDAKGRIYAGALSLSTRGERRYPETGESIPH